MIEVIYNRAENHVTVTGHAHSDEYGRDLICSAASILTLTLGANVEHMYDSGCVDEPVMKLEEGNAEISCKAVDAYRDSVRQTFMSVCVGFEILASKWPDYISYSVRGW